MKYFRSMKLAELYKEISQDENNRKTAYMKYFRSMKLAELYKEISQDENPFVPKEFRITVSESTSQEEKDLRSRQSIQHLKDEIDVLLVRSTTLRNNLRRQIQKSEHSWKSKQATLQLENVCKHCGEMTVKTKRAQPTKYGKTKKVRTDRHTKMKRKKRPFTH